MPSTASFWTIINAVYDSSSAALRMNLSYDHTHSSGSGSGGQLDWDVIWSDAVHSHGTDTEGGQLDWDVVWSDAVHSHGTNTEGGQLDAATAVPNAVTKNTLTTLGDIPYASGSATWTRHAIGSANSIFTTSSGGTGYSWLNIGSANQTLIVNSGGTGYSWVSAVARITSGSYTGNDGVNTAITHNLGVAPKFVTILNNDASVWFQIIDGTAKIYFRASGGDGAHAVTAPDGTSFYVGNATSPTQSANGTTVAYRWVAQG